MAKREKERIESCEGMLCLVRTIRQNIAFFRIPLDEIYKRFSYQALQSGSFLTQLHRQGLKSAYLAERERFGYDSFTESRFINFADSIGGLPLEEQLRSCDMLCEILEENLRESKSNYPTQKKLYHVLSISLGIAIVILFL